MQSLSTTNWPVLLEFSLPFLIVTTASLLLLLLAAFFKRPLGLIAFLLSLAAALVSLFFAWKQWWLGMPLQMQMLTFDRFAYFFDLVFLIALVLTLLLSRKAAASEPGEFHALLLLATAGLMLIAHSDNLLLLFLGIEIASISAYLLAAFQKGSIRSYEASLKYFILGSFASGFLLFGIAYLYGATGSVSFKTLSQSRHEILLLIGVATVLIGLFFKIAAVPFHFWVPDVYEGSPTPVTAFMASAIKAGGFVALLRLVFSLGNITAIPWVPLLWVISALTMTVGNLVALRQNNIKRMLAYSSIAHAGYALVGVTAGLADPSLGETAFGSVLFYLLAYSLMTIGAFAVVIAMSRKESTEPEELSDYTQLADQHPVLAAALTLFLLSLVGIPPTIGFVGKFYLFSGAVQAGLVGLVVVAVLNSVVSVFYYLTPVMKMYFQKGRTFELQPLSRLLLVGIFVGLFGVLYLGIFPSNLFLIATESVKGLVF